MIFGTEEQYLTIRSMLKGFANLKCVKLEKRMIVNQLSFREHIDSMLHLGTWATDLEVIYVETYSNFVILSPQLWCILLARQQTIGVSKALSYPIVFDLFSDTIYLYYVQGWFSPICWFPRNKFCTKWQTLATVIIIFSMKWRFYGPTLHSKVFQQWTTNILSSFSSYLSDLSAFRLFILLLLFMTCYDARVHIQNTNIMVKKN